jgi:cell division protein FtsB
MTINLYLRAMKDEKYTSIVARWAQKSWARYVLALLIFLVWITFFDRYSLVEKARLRADVHALQRKSDYYSDKLSEDTRRIEELRGDREELEKFARERYFMKRPNEDLFIITDD